MRSKFGEVVMNRPELHAYRRRLVALAARLGGKVSGVRGEAMQFAGEGAGSERVETPARPRRGRSGRSPPRRGDDWAERRDTFCPGTDAPPILRRRRAPPGGGRPPPC